MLHADLIDVGHTRHVSLSGHDDVAIFNDVVNDAEWIHKYIIMLTSRMHVESLLKEIIYFIIPNMPRCHACINACRAWTRY